MGSEVRLQKHTEEAAHIRDKLKSKTRHMARKYKDGGKYIPEYALSEWVTRSAVGKWIDASKIEVTDRSGFRDQICKMALKTFCILIEVEREDAIKHFVERSDPTEGPDNMLWRLDSEYLRKFMTDAGENPKLWPIDKCEEFCDAKWKYIAAKLPYGTRAHLEVERILPFRQTKDSEDRGETTLYEGEFDGRYLIRNSGEPYSQQMVCHTNMVMIHILTCAILG